MSKKLKIWIAVVSSVTALLIAALIALAVLSGGVKLDEAKLKPAQNEINVFDRNGEIIKKQDNYLTIDAMPQNLKDAFVALEDKRFYKHNGVDLKRIASALWADIKSGSLKEGGSTITQQLIKNTHLDGDKNFRRKLREARLSLELEKKYDKDEILEMYLNVIYLGSGVYGVKDGASRFFGKQCSELSLAECASIACITKNPSRYCPVNNLENNRQRAKTVIKLMLEQKKIDEKQYETALSEIDALSIAEDARLNENCASQYISNAYAEASDILGVSVSEIKKNGYRLHTYYDEKSQSAAYYGANSEALSAKTEQGAAADRLVVLVDNETGGITAYYSSLSTPLFYMRRQPGSLIKPFYSYAPALELNAVYTTSILHDEKKSFEGYSPSNYADAYRGEITLKEALSHSSNVCAVELAYALGEETCFKIAKDFGLKLDDKDKTLSAALGGLTYGVSPADLACAYAALASGGSVKPPSFIMSIEDKDGKTVYSHSEIETKQAVSPQTAYLLADILRETAKHGTAKKLGVLPFSVYSKTGTVSHTDKGFNTDAWNAAYTSKHTVVSWYGSAENDRLPADVTGGSFPTLLSKAVLESIYDEPPAEIPMPDGIVKVDLIEEELKKGVIKRADSDAAPGFSVATEYFKTDFAPPEIFTSKDVPEITYWRISRKDGADIIEIDAKKGCGYEIIRENLFGGKTVVFDGVARENEKLTVSDGGKSALALYRYVLKPYIKISEAKIYGTGVQSRLITVFG